MSFVVVKYADKDSEKGLSVVTVLRDAGLDVADPDDGPTPSLDAASCLILLWSEATAGAPTAQQDIQQAVQAWSSGRLILVILDDAALPVGLRDLPAIGLPAGESGWTDLAQQVRSIAAPPQVPDQSEPVVPNLNRRKAILRPMLWISACAFVVLGAVFGSLTYTTSATRDLGGSSSDIIYVIAFVIVGATAGALTDVGVVTTAAAPQACRAFARRDFCDGRAIDIATHLRLL